LPNGRLYYNTDLYIDPPAGRNTIVEAGNVGIGTTSPAPQAPLEALRAEVEQLKADNR